MTDAHPGYNKQLPLDTIHEEKENNGSIIEEKIQNKLETGEAQEAPLSKDQKRILMSMLLSIGMTQTLYMNAAALLPPQAEEQFTTDETRISKGLIALIIAMFEIAYIIGAPFIGVLLPKVGRKNFIVIGYFIIVCGTLGFAFISLIPETGRGLWIGMAILLRFLQGFGDSCVATSVYSAITIEFPKQRELFVGYCQSAVGIGLMVGPVMGSALNDSIGFEMTFIVFAALMFGCNIMVIFLLPARLNKVDEPVEEEVIVEIKEGEKPITFKMFYTNIQCIITSVSAALAMIFMLFFGAIIGDHMSVTFGFSNAQAGYFLSISAFVYAFASAFVGPVFKGVPRRYVFFLGFILATTSLFYIGNSKLLGYPSSIGLLVVGLILLGISVSLIFVPLLSEIIETVQEKEGLGENPLLNDKASAVFNASYATGCVLGPIVGSELFERFSVMEGSKVIVSGFPHTCDVMALCAAGFCAVYFLVNIVPHWFKKSNKKRPTVADSDDVEKQPIIVNLEDTRSQLRIENVDDSFTGLKKPMLEERSMANDMTMAGSAIDDSNKFSTKMSMFDPVNSLTEKQFIDGKNQ